MIVVSNPGCVEMRTVLTALTVRFLLCVPVVARTQGFTVLSVSQMSLLLTAQATQERSQVQIQRTQDFVQVTQAFAVPAPHADSMHSQRRDVSAALPDEAWCTVLKRHNKYRLMHGVDPLAWDAQLASDAQANQNACDWAHNNVQLQALAQGENTFGGTQAAANTDLTNSFPVATPAMVDSWYSQVSKYNTATG